ncbi:MAG: DUF2231 domain-containing protein [Candidatus Zixiibacteriota bacterium]|nr:MAG: DUF2231 domain-containing protein [candidate division Zixibacteria bacterium]
MASPASIKKHPIHPMLIPLPIGLWVFSVISEIVYRITGRGTWRSTANDTMFGGIFGALAAAIPGFIDYMSIKQPHARKTATRHMLLNLSITGIFTTAYALRRYGRKNENTPFLLTLLGVSLLAMSGWLGWKLVYEHRVGVSEPEEHGEPGEEAYQPQEERQPEEQPA